MVKRLLITILSGLVILLVLAGAILLVFSTRGYFSDVITWLLIGLIGILVLFTVYMVITYSIEIVHKKDHDVEDLSEQSIQTMLKTGEIPVVHTPAKKSNLPFFLASLGGKPKSEQEGKPQSVAPTQVPMPTKVNPSVPSSSESPEAQKENATGAEAVTKTAPESEEERQKAVEAVRMQAEAAAVARRKAASMAARSQAFPAIRTDQLASFADDPNAGNTASRPDSRAHILNPKPAAPSLGLDQTGSIWEQMNVRQSAAPLLDHPDAPPPVRDITPRQVLGKTSSYVSSHAVSSADLEAASQPWQPPKQPRAWSGGGKMPGDMGAFAKPNTVQGAPDAQKRAEEARAKAKIAEEKLAAAKGDVSLESATNLAEDIRRKRSLKSQEGDLPATAPRRGRPPKPKTEEELNAPKRPPGRPPKPKTEEELNAPKRPRGRPPKPKTEEELNAPKRPRGRPRKTPLPAEPPADTQASSLSE